MDEAIWAKIVRSPVSSPIIRAILTNSSLAEFKPSEGLATISCTARYAAGAKARIGEIAVIFEKEVGRRFTITIHEPGEAASAGATAAEAPAAPPVAAATVPGAEPATEATPRPSTPPPPAFNAAEDPLIRQALELFSARIVSVQPR